MKTSNQIVGAANFVNNNPPPFVVPPHRLLLCLPPQLLPIPL